MFHPRRIAGLALCAALVAGCGSDDSSTPGSSDPVDPTPAATDVAVTEPAVDPATDASTPAAPDAAPEIAPEATDAIEVPERVVSLSPTHTEMIFAIGAEELLVAVDDQSNHPEAALALPNELSGFEPDVEAIAAVEPDLVITGGDFTGLGEQLAGLGIAAWDGPPPATIDGIYGQIVELGAALGRVDDARAVATAMRDDVTAAIAAMPQLAEPLEVYHELDPSLFSVDSTTFIGDVYTSLGLRNVADRIEGDFGGYPQLNQEFLVSADPDLVVLADTKCCGESADTVAARPGWEQLTAVANGNVVELDDDIASRWGPRIVEFVQAVAAAAQAAS